METNGLRDIVITGELRNMLYNKVCSIKSIIQENKDNIEQCKLKIKQSEENISQLEKEVKYFDKFRDLIINVTDILKEFNEIISN